jgi:transcriptional regulator with XRE-family HTH domain
MAKRKSEEGLTGQLRKAIQESGQSLNQLSKTCGVHNTQLSRFMRGERDITLAAATRICEALRLRLTSAGPPAQPKKRPRKNE